MKRLFVVSVLCLGAAACSGSTAPASGDATSQSAAAATKAPVAAQLKAPHLRIVADALGDVALRPDQRTEIEQMAKDADARHEAARQAHVDLANALATQIEAGAIDRAALQPKVDAAVAAFAASRPGDRAALERLHAILTPEQRAEFVDALKARFHAKMGERAGHDGRKHMEEWATALKLTDAQKDQIHQLVMDGMKAHHAEMKEGMHHGHDVLESFKSDTFAPPPPPDAKGHASAMAEHVIGFAEKVLPILTPEQRQIAAQKIRERAASGDLEPAGE